MFFELWMYDRFINNGNCVTSYRNLSVNILNKKNFKDLQLHESVIIRVIKSKVVKENK